MKHVVGLDLRSTQQSPAAFATWLSASCVHRPEIRAVHAIHERAWSTANPDLREQIELGARQAMQTAFAELAAGTQLDIQLKRGGRPEEILVREAADSLAGTIIVSRHTPGRDQGVIRLGRVARRLLRALPTPVIVVPSDFTVAAAPAGPVILAADGHHDATEAVHFARRLSTDLERPLLVAHVYPEHFKPGVSYVPSTYLPGMHERYRQQQHERFGRWREQRGFSADCVRETEGHAVPRLLDIGRDEQASIVVVASRNLSAVARIFASSVGSQLAASASFPVAVIPHS